MHKNIDKHTSYSKIKKLDLKFAYPWRPEQQRVLDHLPEYLDDKRIHIVAAPGAGKTVIGLEIFKRLRYKTLAIAPTTVVRNQWIERLNDFLPDEDCHPNWTSTDLYRPKLLTSATYQGLFSFDKRISSAKGDDDIQKQYESIKTWLREHDIGLLILDEAHHLKAAWWKVLIKLVAASNDLIIVSLTATPPYDASSLEWSRYQQLCGPVDEEISIPELVRSNSLCPHQDYIWLVKTDQKNISALQKQQSKLDEFVESLQYHHELNYLLQLHDWLQDDATLDAKLLIEALDECFALLGLLKLNRQTLPPRLLKLLSLKAEDIEEITVFGWQVLLQSLIKGDQYPTAEPVQAFQQELARILRNQHFLKHRRVSLDNSQKKLKNFNKTQERIKACFDIANVEYAARQNWMRLVVLTDYIRDEKYQLSLDSLEATTGAYPIFHYYIHHFEDSIAPKIALLTGRLAIIHQSLLSALADQLPQTVELVFSTYSQNPNYVVLSMSTDVLSIAFTKLHQHGQLMILIGTRGLLGEGWDAPHVNALILATQTGAYVTTNQLRGRAIRIDPHDELKTSSIWHIIATVPDATYNKFILKDLHRRFKTFAGIHATELRIESGIERLALNDEELLKTDITNLIEQSNQLTIKRLQDDIYNLQARWQNALEKADKHVFQPGLHMGVTPEKHRNNLSSFIARIQKKHSRQNQYAYVSLGSAACIMLILSLAGVIPAYSGIIGGLGLGGLLYFISKFFKKTGKDTSYYPYKFAEITLAALHRSGAILKSPETSSITITEVAQGYCRFTLNGYLRRDNDIFLTALSQLLEPIQQARYLLVLKPNPSLDDIFPVPHILGGKKANAEIFVNIWKQYLPEFKKIQLISTLKPEGRALLLKIKAKNYREQDEGDIRLIERWE